MKSSDVIIIGHKFPKMVIDLYMYIFFIKYDYICMICIFVCRYIMSQQLQSRLCEFRKKFIRDGKNTKDDRIHLEE